MSFSSSPVSAQLAVGVEDPVLFSKSEAAMFRSLETLAQKAGVAVENLGALAVKELVDNALDAGAGVKLFKTPGGFIVQDDGPGIPGDDATLASFFSFGREMTSSKLLRLPTRGMLGNGLRVVAGLVYCSGASVVVRTRGRALLLEPREDGTTTFETLDAWEGVGTEIEITGIPLESAMARPALLAGHKGEKYGGNSSAFWYSDDAFHELLRATSRPLRDVITRLDGCARYSLPAELKGRRANEVDRDESRELLTRLRAVAKPVNPSRLGFVGEDLVPGGYARLTTTFKANGCDIPAVVEVWASNATRSSATLLLNRTAPTLEARTWYDEGGVEFYANPLLVHARAPRDTRLNLTVSVITPYIPLLSDGKHPDLSVLAGQIENAFKRAVAKAVARPAPIEKSQKDVVLESLDAAIEAVSTGGTYRYSLRDLFYEMRPLLIPLAPKGNPDYDTFASIIRAEEERRGDYLPGVFRDARGTLYIPHTHESIPLGTLAVEEYEHREWTFTKVLFVEKEGKFPSLIDLRFPDRFDCALVTSKGFSTGAVNDVLRILGGHEVQAFVVHDADAYGSLIYQDIQQSLPDIEVIDLGLTPEEGLDMGLQVETFPALKSRRPVARSYHPDVTEWLQTHRIELNAMRPEVFLPWLERKMAPYHTKLVPPAEIMSPAFREAAVEATANRLREEILREAGFESRLQERLARIAEPENLSELVTTRLMAEPALHWREAVNDIGKEAA